MKPIAFFSAIAVLAASAWGQEIITRPLTSGTGNYSNVDENGSRQQAPAQQPAAAPAPAPSAPQGSANSGSFTPPSTSGSGSGAAGAGGGVNVPIAKP